MIQRRVVVPAGIDRLWQALTDPEEAGQWLGGRLDWGPEEGGSLTFTPVGAESGPREGRIEEVVPGRYMRFVWWPAERGPDGASEVAYILEPVVPGSSRDGADGSTGDGSPATVLTVEEVPAPAVASAVCASAVCASAAWPSAAGSPAACAAGGSHGSLHASLPGSWAGGSAGRTWGIRDEAEWQAFAARQLVGAVAR